MTRLPLLVLCLTALTACKNPAPPASVHEEEETLATSAPPQDVAEVPPPSSSGALDKLCPAQGAPSCKGEAQACQSKQFEACIRLATDFVMPEGELEVDAPKANAVLDFACQAGSQEACLNFALHHEQGIGFGGPKLKEARERFEALCTDEVVLGCAGLWRALVRENKAQEAIEQGGRWCLEKSAFSVCREMGEFALLSQNVRAVESSLELLEHACHKGEHLESCYLLAKALLSFEGDEHRRTYGRNTLVKTCERGMSEACRQAGVQFEAEGAALGPTAAMYYERGCLGGDPPSCGLHGTWLMTHKRDAASSKLAVERLEVGCEFGQVPACTTLARMTRASGAPKLAEAALARVQQKVSARCAQESRPVACAMEGEFWDKGWSGRRDPAKAAVAREKACALGVVNACQRPK